jgi:hypothetical protein
MPQLSVKRFNSRYMRWAAARAATAFLPTLHRRVPMYRDVVRFPDAGRASFLEETQTLSLTPEEAEAGGRTQEGVPSSITRSIALVCLAGATILGNTGAVIDEVRKHLILPRDGRDNPSYHEQRGETTAPIVKKDGVYFNMLGPHMGHRHYFHFLTDYLPRLYYFLERFEEGRGTVTVLVNEDLSATQSAMYGALAAQYRNIRFEAVPRRERWTLPLLYHVDDLQTAPGLRFPVQRALMSPGMFQFLRDTAFAACNFTPDLRGTRRLYLSRDDAKKRRILNESAFEPALTRNGFETVLPGTMALEEQVPLFSQASVICGAHGAGLTNMLFAPPGAHIIEILPDDRQMATYLLLAKSAGHSYEGVRGGAGGYRQHFMADAAKVSAALDMAEEIARTRAA